MSLKAKIEAVIYAAEEPVTLAQLVGLLGQEAQAEMERARARQGNLALGEAGDATDEEGIPSPSEPDQLNDELLAIETGPPMEGDEMPASETSAKTGAPELLYGREIGAPDPATGASMTKAATTASGTADDLSEQPASKDEKQATRERERAVRDHLGQLLTELVRDYAEGDRGLEIREVAGGYRLATKPEYHDAVRGFVKALKPPLKLTLQALETLAVVAYKQPVTAPEISEIRGVDSGGVLGSLMARKLVTTAGRKQVIGRPILYKTTKDFLLRFGLKDTSELPSIEEFEKMAGELAAQEEIPMTIEDTGAESPHTDPELAGSQVESPGLTHPGTDVIGTSDGGGMIDNLPAPQIPPPQSDVAVPQADGDGSPADEIEVDGRMAGILPRDKEIPVDSSAGDAMIQEEQREAEEKR